MSRRIWLLVGAALATVVIVLLLPPIPQSETYHNFADHRALLGIPNCLDTLSNLPFLGVGFVGMLSAVRNRLRHASLIFVESSERWPYFVFFFAVALTAFGSAYYHLRPGNERLV